MSKAWQLLVQARGDSSGGQRAMRDLQKAGRRLSSAIGIDFKNVAKMGALALGVGLAATIKEGVAGLASQQKATAQSVAVLKSMGTASGMTVRKLESMSTSIERMTGIEAESVQAGQNLLLTFGNIRNEAGKGNDVFNRTTKIMADMSVALGQDTKASAIQLGKALNDPIKGVTALQKVGVSFTQAQKDQIKAMVESGDTMGAQKLILGELDKQFAGSAKAYGQTMPGMLARARAAFGELAENLVSAVLPSVTKLAQQALVLVSNIRDWSKTKSGQAALADVRNVVQTLGSALVAAGGVIATIATKMYEWRAVLIPVAGGILVMVAALKAWRIVTAAVAVAQAALNVVMTANPIGLIVLAIIGLVAALVIAYKRSETFRDIVNGAFEAVKVVVTTTLAAIGTVITTALEFVRGLWDTHGAAIQAVVGGAWGYIKTYITSVINVVRGIVQTVTALLHGDWSGAWEGIKATLAAAWLAMKTLVAAYTAPMRAVVDAIWGAIKGALPAAWEAIKGALSSAWDALKTTITGYKDDITGAVSGIWNAIKGAIPAAWTAIKNAVVNAANDIPAAIVGAIDNVVEKFASVGSRAGSALAGAIKGAINGIIKAWNGLSFEIPALSVAGKEVFGGAKISPPNLPLFARGGITNRPGIFGEAGWEAAIPLGSGAQATRDRERVLRQAGLAGNDASGMHLTMNFRSDPDPFVASRRMAFAMQTAGLVGR